MTMDPEVTDLMSRFAALSQHLPEGTESWDIVSIPVSAALIFAAGKMVEAHVEHHPNTLKRIE